jgi:hypothetical protein
MRARSPASLQPPRLRRFTPALLLVASACLILALLAGACRQLDYTDDGVPLVPFADAEAAGPAVAIAGGSVHFTIEAWTNRMPGPARPSGESDFPLNVLVRCTPDSSRTTADSFLVPAVTLWNAAGDSVLAPLALVRIDGSAPWVRTGNGATATELTADRSRPRRLGGAPNLIALPRLLIVAHGRNRILALPDTPVTAAY